MPGEAEDWAHMNLWCRVREVCPSSDSRYCSPGCWCRSGKSVVNKAVTGQKKHSFITVKLWIALNLPTLWGKSLILKKIFKCILWKKSKRNFMRAVDLSQDCHMNRLRSPSVAQTFDSFRVFSFHLIFFFLPRCFLCLSYCSSNVAQTRLPGFPLNTAKDSTRTGCQDTLSVAGSLQTGCSGEALQRLKATGWGGRRLHDCFYRWIAGGILDFFKFIFMVLKNNCNIRTIW